MKSYFTQVIYFHPGDPNDIEFYTDEIVFYSDVIVFYPNDVVFNHNVLFFLNQYNIDLFFTFCTPNDNIFYQNDIFLYLNDIVFTPMISYLTPTCLNCFNVFLKLLYTCKNETRGQYDFTVT